MSSRPSPARAAPPARPLSNQRELDGRVEELECVYALFRLLADQTVPVPSQMQQVAELLPRAIRFPECACARVRLRRREFRSPDYETPVASLRAPFQVFGKPAGFLEVGYRSQCPPADEGPFLREERELLEAAARRVASLVELREAHVRLSRSQAQLRSLAARLILTEENERRRLALALHDRLGHALAIAKLKVGMLQAKAAPPQAEDLTVVSGLLGRAIDDVRSLTSEISPPVLYEQGLKAALDWLAERIHVTLGLDVQVRCQTRTEAPEEVRLFLFRAARELLTNVAKHAGASRATLSLEEREGRLFLEVTDTGKGFSSGRLGADRRGFGLFSIGERLRHLGGELAIQSSPGQGTRVLLRVPLPPARRGRTR
jgi:two-component system NarL family sensor kinase